MARTKKSTTENTLRVVTSNMNSSTIKKGDFVEFVDDSPSPMGRKPRTLTIGKKYEVLGVKDCVICVENDRGDFVTYYSNRFKKKTTRKRR